MFTNELIREYLRFFEQMDANYPWLRSTLMELVIGSLTIDNVTELTDDPITLEIVSKSIEEPALEKILDNTWSAELSATLKDSMLKYSTLVIESLTMEEYVLGPLNHHWDTSTRDWERHVGARLMCMSDFWSHLVLKETVGQAVNIIETMNKTYLTYYNSPEWFNQPPTPLR